MTVRQALTNADRETFPVGQPVRYLPGSGTYGFEDCVGHDGRLAGVVLGHTDTRIRVELTLTDRGGMKVRRAVNAAQLVRAPHLPQAENGLSSRIDALLAAINLLDAIYQRGTRPPQSREAGVELARAVVEYFGAEPIDRRLTSDIALRDCARAIIALSELNS